MTKAAQLYELAQSSPSSKVAEQLSEFTSESTGPIANDNDPFLLMRLEDVRVTDGAMHRDTLVGAEDIIAGDVWNLSAASLAVRANLQQAEGRATVTMTQGLSDASCAFDVARVQAVILMSDRGTLLECDCVTFDDGLSRSYLLLPARFDDTQLYQLISN